MKIGFDRAMARMGFTSFIGTCLLSVVAATAYAFDGAEDSTVDQRNFVVVDEAAELMNQSTQPVIDSNQSLIDALNQSSTLRGLQLDPALSPMDPDGAGVDVDALIEQYHSIKSGAATEGQKKPIPPVMIFVSSSMPKQSMRKLIHSIEGSGVPLIFRGLVNNNLKDYVSYLVDLLHEDGLSKEDVTSRFQSLEFQIDPQLFEKFGIDQVPATTAVRHKPATCLPRGTSDCDRFTDVEHFSVYGDVSPAYALKQIQRLAPEFTDIVSPVLDQITKELESSL